jgi:hypothetical protein
MARSNLSKEPDRVHLTPASRETLTSDMYVWLKRLAAKQIDLDDAAETAKMFAALIDAASSIECIYARLVHSGDVIMVKPIKLMSGRKCFVSWNAELKRFQFWDKDQLRKAK